MMEGTEQYLNQTSITENYWTVCSFVAEWKQFASCVGDKNWNRQTIIIVEPGDSVSLWQYEWMQVMGNNLCIGLLKGMLLESRGE